MRESLRKSVADSPAERFERYPKGSVLLCNACAKPIAKLDYGIALGDRSGRCASALKPLSADDIRALASRMDIDAGVRAFARGLTPEQLRDHVAKLHEFRAGDPMLCPVCDDCFVQVLAVDRHEVLDKAYTMELVTIPPPGAGKPVPVRGKRLGTTKGWLHEDRAD